MFLHIFPITDYCFNLFVIMNFLSNNKWPQEGISYTFQIPPNISIEREKIIKWTEFWSIFTTPAMQGAGATGKIL